MSERKHSPITLPFLTLRFGFSVEPAHEIGDIEEQPAVG